VTVIESSAQSAATQGRPPLEGTVALAEVLSVSIVIPVYRGARTLEALVAEIEPLTQQQRTPAGRGFRVGEVFLVHDGAVDDSELVMRRIAGRCSFVSLIWLSRNYGQHPATLAGMASTTSEWVVTMDEDGQHDPRDIGKLLDRALDTGSQLVYAQGTNPPPHGPVRSAASKLTKWLFVRLFDPGHLGSFNSFRLVEGEIARSLAAFCGHGVFLDVALSWLVAHSEACGVVLRGEERPSGYDFGKLFSHFMRLVLTSGTRPLRFISYLGVFAVLLAIVIAGYALWGRFTLRVPVQGWTSTVIVLCFFSGCILVSLGILAEYLGVALTMAMGKPLYLVVSRPMPKSRKP
jgi:undecaprenyl-phosphate 4-deoxy-4-formamido-L-arabinose transferase